MKLSMALFLTFILLMSGCTAVPQRTAVQPASTIPLTATITAHPVTPAGSSLSVSSSISPASTTSPTASTFAPNEAFPGTILLGEPTANSITLSLLSTQEADIYVQYGKTRARYDSRTSLSKLEKDKPLVLTINNLEKDAQYYYQVCYKTPGKNEFLTNQEGFFHTQRMPGESFVFTIQADSHRDESSSDDIYKTTLFNALSEKPDFHIDLGDTFMGDKWAKSASDLAARYVQERSFFGLLNYSAPLFMVNGNHEGENGWMIKNQANSLPVWATTNRKLYYPTPEPGAFYSGSTKVEQYGGIRQSYYAWTWGDALLVVLDPYWYTSSTKSPAGWDWTLGKEQYDWLKSTLENSQARSKLVFCHNLVGGFDLSNAGNGRGGVEAAKFYEWGGRNTDRSWGFDTNRPGWNKPIHQLLVDNKVDIFFHGHDHFFAKQEADGVVYQECPQPGAVNDRNHAEEYGYKSGVFMEGCGHLRVTVTNQQVTVDYIRTFLPGKAPSGHTNGEVAYSYTLKSE